MLARSPLSNAPLKAANDNGAAWPMIPFPQAGTPPAERQNGASI